jgi:hypothetical protein
MMSRGPPCVRNGPPRLRLECLSAAPPFAVTEFAGTGQRVRAGAVRVVVGAYNGLVALGHQQFYNDYNGVGGCARIFDDPKVVRGGAEIMLKIVFF